MALYPYKREIRPALQESLGEHADREFEKIERAIGSVIDDALAAPDVLEPESFVRTTSSADQTLTTGVLTILDYDVTSTNNDTANYTVDTAGRITVAEAGIYDITTGVVVQASAVSAASATALGLFVNANLVAVDTAETTLAVDEQRGHSISTQIALEAGDIVDARARVTSVGGVGNGLARRLATLLGSTATQVNHLSIAKCAQSTVGPLGPAGPAGPTGPTGATGPTGPIGPTGVSASIEGGFPDRVLGGTTAISGGAPADR
jgi:hypothetical protein